MDNTTSQQQNIEALLVELKERLVKEFKEREDINVNVSFHASMGHFGEIIYNVVTQGPNFTEVHSVYQRPDGIWDYCRNIQL